MASSSLIPQSNLGITAEAAAAEDDEQVLGSMMSSPSSDSFDSSSSSSDDDDAPSSLPVAAAAKGNGPLYEMASLMEHLPLRKRRGLSRFYEGKAQSFACLSDARGLEDLGKAVRPLKKKLKLSRSCGAMGRSRVIAKKGLRGSFRRPPPIPPQRAAGISAGHSFSICMKGSGF